MSNHCQLKDFLFVGLAIILCQFSIGSRSGSSLVCKSLKFHGISNEKDAKHYQPQVFRLQIYLTYGKYS